MINTLFYKYIDIEQSLEELREEQRSKCEDLELKGKILVSKEGINGNLTGDEEDIEAYKAWLREDHRFSDTEFKDGYTEAHNFKRLLVKIRDEIITTHHDPHKELVGDKAEYIEPEELKELYEEDADFVVVDTRNTYEYEEGHFEDAEHLNIEKFSEFFPKIAERDDLKEKTTVIYCTGGVRCEKASAWMKHHGFKDVRHLRGGILRYGEKLGNRHWEGECFVFDQRHTVNIDPEQQGDDAQKLREYQPYYNRKEEA